MFKFIETYFLEKIKPSLEAIEMLTFEVNKLNETIHTLTERTSNTATLSAELSKKLSGLLKAEELILLLKQLQEKSLGIDESDFQMLSGKVALIARLLQVEEKK
jgi:FtsZ-binding cell division protein ZapB